MKHVFTALAFVIGATGPVYGAAKLSAEDLQKKMVQSAYAQSEESVYVMKLAEAGGAESLRKMRVWFKRDPKSDDASSAKLLIKFQEPADIRGTALLSVADDGKTDQWLYLPKLKKTRRIKGGNENESFLGSDFTVGDLTSLDNDKERYTYTVTAEGKKCGEATCYVLTGTPKSGVDLDSLAYAKKVVEVRADNFMSTRVEFYNKDSKLEKVMEMKGVHKVGTSFVADRLEMRNLLNGHATVIEIQSRDASKAPADSTFTQTNLERG